MHLTLMQMVAAGINFFLLLFILKVFLYRPVFLMLDARRAEIESNLSAAEKAKQSANELRTNYEQNLKEAHVKAQSIIQEATDLGEKTRSEIVSEARQEAARATDKAKEEIAREKDQALQDLRHEVVNLAVDVAEKVVGRNITATDHDKMIDEFIKEVGDAR